MTRLLKMDEAAAMLGVSRTTFKRLRNKHAELKAFVVVNGSMPRWTQDQLITFLRAEQERIQSPYSNCGGRREKRVA